MTIKTTCIGAWPKPAYVRLPDWFNIPGGLDGADLTGRWKKAMEDLGPDAEAIISRGIQEVVQEQVRAGIDIPTDGEVPRENYIHYHCRHLNGFDFVNLTNREMRGGACAANLPTISGPVSVKQLFAVEDWKRAQAYTDRPVKFTMPGPMTVSDTSADAHYHDPARLGADIADALNREVLALAEAGCRYIQIDEPLFARKPAEALDYGFDNLERAFHGCPRHIERTVHMCCGYPDRLDHPDYPKADPGAYLEIADAVEASSIDAVSVEDAHRHNDLHLLEHFRTTKVIFGLVAIAKSRVEGVDEIRERLLQVLAHIDRDRLIAAPDCGLGLLSRDLVVSKLNNLCAAARSV
ncbi:MAG: cobalamin-independent methionine synthase II family protein [Gammaproteobacteria bacterium]|nr:cobalamin-independent methionine synthase II family protein [Gammaproteobacteria bacterium]MYJ53137.1 cobalamin-independent methionine synthase II family protein [Gammaproteobacteria bacterium]